MKCKHETRRTKPPLKRAHGGRVFPCHFACFTLSLHFFRYIVNKRNKERSVHFIFNGMVFCVVEWRQRKRTFMNTTKPTLKDRGSLRSFLSLTSLHWHSLYFISLLVFCFWHSFHSLVSCFVPLSLHYKQGIHFMSFSFHFSFFASTRL